MKIDNKQILPILFDIYYQIKPSDMPTPNVSNIQETLNNIKELCSNYFNNGEGI